MRLNALGIITVALALCACQTVPVTGRKGLMLVTVEQERRLGVDAYAEALKEGKVSKDAKATSRVREIGRRLAEAADRPDFDWEFNLLESDQINAWCLPGGKVAVYTGLLPVAKDDAGLAVVMGHEIAHALARHGAERMSQGMIAQMGGNILAHKKDLGDTPTVTDLIGIVKVMLDAYLEKRIDALYICSNEFISTMRQEPRTQQILPLVPSENTEIQHHWDYIYEPDNAPQLMGTLLTRYIESQVYRSVIENIACEQAARMLAMRNATDNAAELIGSLQLIYNKARQAAITRELSEIVAGASVI